MGRVPIRFMSYNIRNYRNGGLETALRGVSQTNLDLGVFQEKYITVGVYTCGLEGYNIVATDEPIRHRNRVAVFYQTSARYAVGAIQQFRAKRCWLPAGDGGAVMVHHRMLPRSQQHLDNRECCLSSQRAPPVIGTAGGRRPKHKLGSD